MPGPRRGIGGYANLLRARISDILCKKVEFTAATIRYDVLRQCRGERRQVREGTRGPSVEQARRGASTRRRSRPSSTLVDRAQWAEGNPGDLTDASAASIRMIRGPGTPRPSAAAHQSRLRAPSSTRTRHPISCFVFHAGLSVSCEHALPSYHRRCTARPLRAV